MVSFPFFFAFLALIGVHKCVMNNELHPFKDRIIHENMIFPHAYNSSLNTTVQLTVTNRTVQCSINNLPRNTTYMVNYYRDNILFAFYRVREPEVVFSSTNLDRIPDFYPFQLSGLYPNFSLGLTSDSYRYGSYRCSVEMADRKSFNSSEVYVKEPGVLRAYIYYEVQRQYLSEFREEQWGYWTYDVACKVNFDSVVEAYSVCFMTENVTCGCYEVRDYGKDLQWHIGFRGPKVYFTENKNASAYPQFLGTIRHRKAEQSTHCQVKVMSGEVPNRFTSTPILSPAPESPIYYGSVKVNISLEASNNTLDPFKYTCRAIFDPPFDVREEEIGAEMYLENGSDRFNWRYGYLKASVIYLHNMLPEHYLFATFDTNKRNYRCKLRLKNGETFYSQIKGTNPSYMYAYV